MVSQTIRREKTRELLLTTARKLFNDIGFERTTTSKILSSSGVSKGGLYHHFASKQELMEAIYIQDCETIFEQSRKDVNANSPLEYLIQTVVAWLQLVNQSALGNILLEQGPKVLGWKKCRDIEENYSLLPMIETIEKCIEKGEVKVFSARSTAQIINAMVAEMAMIQLHDKTVSSDDLTPIIRKMIEGLSH